MDGLGKAAVCGETVPGRGSPRTFRAGGMPGLRPVICMAMRPAWRSTSASLPHSLSFAAYGSTEPLSEGGEGSIPMLSPRVSSWLIESEATPSGVEGIGPVMVAVTVGST